MSNTEKKISRYPVPEIKDLPEDVQAIFKSVKEELGFIPNVMKALSHRPAELRAFLAYHNAVVEKESGLSRAEMEMLIVAHSGYNGCTYCIMSHGATLRKVSGNPYIADQVAVNYLEADITPREKAIIDFAMKITKDSRAINEEDFVVLRTHGLNDEDIWDIAGISSFYNMSNRLMNFAAVRADDEFYTMGRQQ